MPLVLRPPGERITIPDRLRALGVARKAARVTAGAGRFVAFALAAVTLCAATDVLFHLLASVRALLLVGLLGGLIAGFARWVRRPLQESAGPLATAHLLEREHPSLNDSLASAVWFLEHPDPFGGSPRFRQVAVARAETLTGRADLSRFVPSGPAWRAVIAVLAAAAVALPLAVWDLPRTGTALVRLIDPFGSHPWPPRTTLELTAPAGRPVLLAKGSPLVVTFVLRGELPVEAGLEVRTSGNPPTEDRIGVMPAEADPTTATVSASIPPDRASQDFEFRVTANDADSGWIPVTVAPPPRLVPLDGRASPRVRLAFPGYTLLPDTDLADGVGAIEAVAGTRVRLAAAADRPIVSASLKYQGDSDVSAAVAVAPLAARPGFTGVLAPTFLDDIPVHADGTRLSADFTVPRSGLYSLQFTDDRGLTGTRLLDIRSLPDPSPTVTLERPSPALDTLALVPTAAVAVRATADDRTFGPRRLVIEYAVNGGPFAELPLADYSTHGPLTGALGVSTRPPMLAANRVVPLIRFTKPDGKPPADGDRITLRAAATDYDDHTLLKPPGRSQEVVIQVLSAESLTALIQKELAALRPDLTRVRDAQQAAADQLAELRRAANVRPLTPEDREKLAQIEQAQRQLRGPIADPDAGLRAKADRLRDAAVANGLPKSSVTNRAEAVARLLDEIDRKHLTEIDGPLADARRTENDPARPLAQAARHQQGIRDGLSAALEELEQWAAAAEVRGDARAARDRAEAARKAAEELAGKLPPGTPADQLPADDKRAVEKVANELDKAAEQAGKLATKADRVAAEKRAAGDPASAAEAAALDKATRAAGGQQAADLLRQAAAAQRANKPSEATAAAAAAADRLGKMTDALSEPSEPPADELAKKRRAAAEEVQQLADQQDLLAKKAKAAAGNPDPAAKADELQKLAEQQDELRREAERLSRKLDREGAGEAAEQLRRASRQMEQAREEMTDGRDPAEKTNDALDRLDEAKEKLEPEPKKDEEQLLREKRDDLAKQLKSLAERQKGAVQESERLTAAAVAAKRWERPLSASLARLADGQAALADEVRAFAEANLKDVKVFDRMARSAADQMTRAGTRLRERKDDTLTADPAAFDPEAETVADEVARRPMRAALKRLEQIAAAVAPDDKKKEKPKADQPMPGGGGGPMPMGNGGQQGGGLPPLAQLKALRDWQTDINERTAAFAKEHPDPAALTDDDRAELRELEQAQKEIAELFAGLLSLLQPAAEGM